MLQKYVLGLRVHLILSGLILMTFFGLSQIPLKLEGMTHITELPLLRAFFEFLLGTIIGSLYIRHQNWLTRSCGFFTVCVFAAGFALVYLDMSTAFAVPFICFSTICVLSIDTSPITRLLCKQPLVYLGEISYSTYMVHYLVYDMYKAIWLQNLGYVEPLSLITSFAIVLGLSMIMHKAVELPAQRYLRSGRFKGMASMALR